MKVFYIIVQNKKYSYAYVLPIRNKEILIFRTALSLSLVEVEGWLDGIFLVPGSRTHGLLIG
jgi:hypothetical protein